MTTNTQQPTQLVSEADSGYRRVLVPLDGHALGERVLPYVERVAVRTSARVTLLRGTNPSGATRDPFFAPGLGYDPLSLPRAADLETDKAIAYLGPIAARLRASGVETTTTTAAGSAADVIVDCVRGDVDLIVMATRARANAARTLLGGVADAVVRRVQIPMLLVPETCTRQWPENGPRKALIAVDGSALGASILEPATAFARQFGTTLILLHVMDSLGSSAPAHAPTVARQVLGIELGAARAWLERIGQDLALELEVDASRVGVGHDVASAILRVAGEEDADLIAVATHGRGGLMRLVLGSVATSVLERSTLPVLLVRPHSQKAGNPDPAAANRELTLQHCSAP